MQWSNTTVGDFCPFVYGKAIKKQDQLNKGIPVYGSNGIYTYSANELVSPYTVVIGRKGSVGKLHISFTPCWVSDTAFYVKQETLEETYFTYYLLSTLGLENMNTDAAVPGLNRDNAHRLKVRIPESAAERKRLIAPLIALDKKINLNNEINQTLEQMAQAIFKSWFVDFEPTRAKIIAKEQGANLATQELAAQAIICGAITLEQLAEVEQNLETTLQQAIDEKLNQHNQTNPTALNAQQLKTTAALFPNELVESELGDIPRGWEVDNLEGAVEIGSAKRIFSKEYVVEGIPFYRGKEVTELSRGNNIQPEIFITNKKYKELKEKSGVPKEHDILITSVGTIGNTYLVRKNDEFYFKDGNLTWIKAYKKGVFPYFFKCWFDSSIGKQAIENIKIGSTQQAITITAINSLKLVFPSEDIHKVFHKTMKANFGQSVENLKQTKALVELRDALLPKLLSGELAVSDSPTPAVKAKEA